MTIIATHANAFPKELYEPLWDDLLAQSAKSGWRIRSIWMADVANQGGSYLLNEHKTGNDPNFMDHSRDLLAMVNQFRHEFPRPVVGVGHSMGATSLINLSFIHPRLMTSIVCIDPVILHRSNDSLWPMLRLPSHRKDLWQSKADVEKAFKKNPLVKRLDARVVDRVLEHSIRPLPTLLYPENPHASKHKGKEEGQIAPSAVETPTQAYTLTTPKHQEAFSIARPNYTDIGVLEPASVSERHRCPDIGDDALYKSPFYKSESKTVHGLLEHIRPSILWLYGSDSYSADALEREIKMRRTGTGSNGSGGAQLGRVKEVLVDGAGHFVCMEKVDECAARISEWLDAEIKVWWEGEKESVCPTWKSKDAAGRQKLDGKWLAEVKVWKGQRQVPTSKL